MQKERFSLNNIPIPWLVAGVGILLFVCLLVLIISVVLIFTARNKQETDFLPPPATSTAVPTATVIADATLSAATTTAVPPATDGRVQATRWQTPPTLDGNLDEWHAVPAFTSPYIVEQEASWDGSLDVLATWRLAWDTQHLYIAVAVEDDVHVQINETKFAYLGDSLELQFDTNVTADYGPGVNSDDFQYVVSPGNFADRAPGIFRFRGDAQGLMSDFIGSNARVAAQQTAVGYNLEIALPWSDLAMQPSAGLQLAAAFSVNDLDTPATAVQELMLSHVSTRLWRDPRSWGPLELLP